MKRLLIILSAMMLTLLPLWAQDPALSVIKPLTGAPNDKDASMSYKEYDSNDELCALIKVNLVGNLSNPLVLVARNVSPISKMVDGQIWFWIPHWTSNISFSCLGYKSIETFSAKLEAGKVYTMTIGSNVENQVVARYHQTSGYIHFKFNIPEVAVEWGKSPDDMTGHLASSDSLVAILLEYGQYFFSFEDPDRLYRKQNLIINYCDTTRQVKVNLKPSYNYLSLSTNPPGAKILVDSKTYVPSRKYAKGPHVIHAQMKDYAMKPVNIELSGDGSTVAYVAVLEAKFGKVTVTCPDREAVLLLDGYEIGKGSWSGNVSSGVTHVLLARRAFHTDQSIKFIIADNEVRNLSVASPVAIQGVIDVTSTPNFSEVYLDDQFIGQTPVRKTVLAGPHTIKLKHDGYITKTFSVFVEQSQNETLNFKLEKGKLYANVTLSVKESGASIVVEGGNHYGGEWHGRLPEGRYTVYSRKAGCIDGSASFTIEGTSPINIVIPDPKVKKGTLRVRTNVGNATIVANGSVAGVTTNREFSALMPEGYYDVYAKARGYESSPTRSVKVPYGSEGYVSLRLNKKLWIKDDMTNRPKFSLEFTYGYNFSTFNNIASKNFLGFNMDYAKHRLGFHISGMYGFEKNDFGLTLGPELRLGDGNWGTCDCHLFCGAGYYHSPQYRFDDYNHIMGDFGVRLGIANSLSDDFSWLSLSLGAKVSKEFFYPNAGISLMIVPALAALLRNSEYDFGWAFLDAISGYDGAWYVGGSFTWIRARLGLYGSYMHSINANDVFSANGGLVFRLTGDNVATDIQTYIGAGSRRSNLNFDLGFRFSWNPYNSKFFTIGLLAGAQISSDGFMPTFGLSFTLAGEAIATACTAGAIVPAFIPR